MLSVTLASCECVHRNTVAVVRASMGSKRLENLVVISAEKLVLDWCGQQIYSS